MRMHDTRNRIYVDGFDAAFLPGLSHFGAMHNRKASPPLTSHVHRGAMEICYVHSGLAHFEVGGQVYPLSGGDVFLTFPDEIHSTGTRSQGLMTLFWLGVRLDVDELFGYNAEESGVLLAALRQIKNRLFRGTSHLKELMEDCVGQVRSPTPFARTILRSRLTDFLLEVVAAEQKHRLTRISPPIQAVLDFLSARSDRPMSIAAMAQMANLSVPRFQVRFKNETGFPPKQWLMELRMKLAESRLSEGQSVTRVALDLGFPSSQHFATMFRIYRGMAPSKFRSSLQPGL